MTEFGINNKFTVICWCNDSYKHLAEGVKSDCEALGYPFHLYEIEQEYPNLVKAWCNHPRIIKKGVLDFGNVLFLDVECRIVRPIPESWKAPLVSVRKPSQPFWIKYNTGTVMADTSCLDWLDAWIRTIDTWEMENLSTDAYIYWPGDVADELAFHAAVAAMDVQLNKVDLEYLDRSSDAEIARGLWRGKNTVVQHPTIHHWRKETDLHECKKLFVQNYAGNPDEAAEIFATKNGILKQNGWIFDTEQGQYAPEEFEQHMRTWLDEEVEITSAQR